MAAGLTAAVALNAPDFLFRGIPPAFYDDGQVTSGLFPMRKRDTLEKGPSVGIEKLIPLKSFQSFIPSDWGVGRFQVSVAESSGLRVCPIPAPEWQGYETAHAVITDYQKLTNSQINEIQRALRDAIRQDTLVHPQK
jgi:hypothetical protein